MLTDLFEPCDSEKKLFMVIITYFLLPLWMIQIINRKWASPNYIECIS
jgi:hypothetical protein